MQRAAALSGILFVLGLFPASGAVDFGRQVLPVLSDNCFACHGPDDKERKAGLRLDLKGAGFQPSKSGERAIVPGDPDKSELMRRILTHDEDDLMPPSKTGKKLTPEQKEVLKQWIAEGAKWVEHWAYQTPQRPALPQVKDPSWARNEIDAFVLARLEQEGLKPSAQADQTHLIRRAALDLVGLPPSPEEVDAFLADGSEKAYEKVVDRLLNSPRYGEQMARYWLDGARYADTHGYHIDSARSIWKYREWVINAFNQNQPFDRFTIDQLAGDLLPEATPEQKTGSGYVRCNMSTGEGGAIVEEYQAKYTFDRVETTATVFMGLTLTCARCHTHKYDPIQHKEYYGLYAFFNNLNESVMDGNQPNPEPALQVPSPEQAQRRNELQAKIESSEKTLEAPMPDLDEKQVAWQKQWLEKLSEGWLTLSAPEIRSLKEGGPSLNVLQDQTILVEGANPETDVFELIAPLQPGPLSVFRLEALPHESLPQQGSGRAADGRFRLSEFEAELVMPDSSTRKLEFGRAVADAAEKDREVDKAIDGKAETGWGVDASVITEPHIALFLLKDPQQIAEGGKVKVRLRFEASQSRRALGHFRLAVAQRPDLVNLFNPPKFDSWRVLGPLEAEDPAAAFAAVHEAEQKIDLEKSYPGVRDPVKWDKKDDYTDGKANVIVQYLHGVHGTRYLHRNIEAREARAMDVSFQADGWLKVWFNGQLIGERARLPEPGERPLKLRVNLKEGRNELLVKVVTITGAALFTFNKDLDDPQLVPDDIAALFATGKVPEAQTVRVRNYFRRQHSSEFKQLFDDVGQWRTELEVVKRAIPTTLVAKEREEMRETFELMRGEYELKGDRVEPGVPAVLPPLPADAPRTRLGLARWLVQPNHPLTARVTVNRLWQQLFGVGLVKTTEDFGVQGEPPSHPELLDWLATDFVQSGWDVKRLLKQMVMSAAYRQSSQASPELRARDPENRLLARGSRFRVDAEVLRDMALYVSGLLVEHQGGESVRPYEPPGLWEAVSYNNSQKYIPDLGASQYRRSLYTYWKRQSPPPNMLLFDAPTREFCVVKRARTNTPLQALALLNDPQFVECSRALAARMMEQGGSTPVGRVAFGFQLVTSRQPEPAETEVLLEVYQQQLAEFKAEPADAKLLLGVGAYEANSGLDTTELAAWTTVASLLLNLDETVTKN